MNYSRTEVDDRAAPTAEDTAQLVVAIVPRAMRQIRTITRSHASSLSVPQFRTLGFLRRHPQANLTALADHLGISLPAASALVSRLVDAGFVERTTDPAERRRVRLALSEPGRERVAASQLAVGEWWALRLARLSPRELATISDGLETLAALLSAEGADASMDR